MDPHAEDGAPDPSEPMHPGPEGRFAWGITGSGHLLVESLALARRLPRVDLFLSAAAEEVLPMYGYRLEDLREHFRVFRDRTASAVPVGTLYAEHYHTLVIAPATSNTVAKCAVGISDSLPTNMFAQAGKLGIPSVVFACDTEPVVVTRAPHDWVTLRPRRIEFENVERLRGFDHCRVAGSLAELEAALEERLAELSLPWNKSSS
jgi:flavoprotein